MRSITEVEGGVIYLLTSPSGKQYVGQTWNLQERMRKYRRNSDKRQRIIYNAIVKHGWDNFAVAIIACGIQTQAALDATEIAFIALLNTLSPHGYNLRAGGKGGKPSDETRAKMSATKRGKKNGMYGKKHSPETIAKMSESQKGNTYHLGKKHSSETRRKMSKAKMGNTNSLGKSKSPETRARISATLCARNAQQRAKANQTSLDL